MKFSSLLLLLSLTANGLLVLAVNRAGLSINAHPSAPSTHQASPFNSDITVLAKSSAAGDSATQLNPTNNTLWSTLQSNDLGEFSRRLRAAGFPSNEIRAMLSMAIDSWMASSRDALLGKTSQLPYWRSSSGVTQDAVISSQMIELYRKEKVLRHQFVNGPVTLADDEDELAAAQRRYGRLPLAKLQQLTELTYTLDDQRLLLSQNDQRDSSSTSNPEARLAQAKAFRKLEQDNLAAVAQLLTPEELLQYQLRNDGSSLAMSLQNFRPTEAEFKAIYAIHRQLTAGFNPEVSQSAAAREAGMAQLKAALDDERAQLQVALGAERSADLQSLQYSGNDKVGKLLARLELPPSTVNKINSVRDDIIQRAAVIRKDTQLQPAQRDTQLAGLAREANDKLTATLGNRGYAAYSDIKGDWIRALKPSSP